MRIRNSIVIFAVLITLLGEVTLARAEDIVIGYTGPLSGPAAEYGQDCLNGIDMAINEINFRGGIEVRGKRYVFRLVRMDDRVSPEKALSNARVLQEELKAIAVFNPVATTILPLMKMNVEKRKEFLLMAYCAVPQVSEMGNRLMITITLPFTVYTQIAVDTAWEKGWRKCAMVVTGGAYGDAWRKAFGTLWLKKGGILTVDKPANYYTRTDFAAPLVQALASDPDFMLIGGPSATTALIVEQARARGFEGGFVMIDQAKLDAVVPVMQKPLGLEGTIGVAMFRDIRLPAAHEFSQNYKEYYQRNVTWESALNYTGMYALAKAIMLAGTTNDVYAIRAAFPGVFPLLGDKYPMEIFALSSGGRFIMPLAVQSMKHGRFTKPIIYAWWPKTVKEFEKVNKASKNIDAQMIWKKID